jgi:hypothetical protein
MVTYTLVIWLIVGDTLQETARAPNMLLEDCMDARVQIRTWPEWRAACIQEVNLEEPETGGRVR